MPTLTPQAWHSARTAMLASCSTLENTPAAALAATPSPIRPYTAEYTTVPPAQSASLISTGSAMRTKPRIARAEPGRSSRRRAALANP